MAPRPKPSKPYDERAAVCRRHDRKLRITIDTDGHGGVVDKVEECPDCRRERVLFRKPDPDERALICEGCNRTFIRKRQRGRLPLLCPACRGGSGDDESENRESC